MNLSSDETYPFTLLALCIWREARGETIPAKVGVAWVIRNRAKNPSWWGKDWISVILKPWQFSSFNVGDPNATKFPVPEDTSWIACLQAAEIAWEGIETDPVDGATHYFDKSLDANPPKWATDGSMVKVCDVDSLRFWKRA